MEGSFRSIGYLRVTFWGWRARRNGLPDLMWAARLRRVPGLALRASGAWALAGPARDAGGLRP